MVSFISIFLTNSQLLDISFFSIKADNNKYNKNTNCAIYSINNTGSISDRNKNLLTAKKSKILAKSKKLTNFKMSNLAKSK